MADDERVIRTLSLLYTENAKVAATFWEWRHKLMDRFFTALAGIAVVVGWLYNEDFKRLLFIPLLLGSLYSIVSFLMDQVNRKILMGCYETGKHLEQQLGPEIGAYGRMRDQYKTVNYSVFLRALYLCKAGALLVFSVFAAILAR